MSRSLWKQRNFMLLWGGQLTSWIGTEISAIALPLVVLALTGSPAKAGSVAAIRGLAYVLWAVPAGVVIDRLNRKTVMVIANLGSGIAMVSISIMLAFHDLSLTWLYIATAIEGSFFVFANLGRFASFPKVVSKEQYPAASAMSGTADHTAVLIGPPLGGLLYQLTGGVIAFLVDSFTYFVNAISIFFINTPLSGDSVAERKSVRHEVREAAVWFWNQPTLRFMNLLTAGRTLVNAGLYLLVITLAKEHHASGFFIGLIFAVGAGGGILGSMFAAKIQKRFSLRQIFIGVSLASLMVFGLYGIATSALLLAVITAVFFAIDPVYEVAGSSYSAKTIPNEIRGRVMSLTRMVVLGAYSFGFFITGNLLQHLGSGWTIVALSGVLFALLLMTLFRKNLAAQKF